MYGARWDTRGQCSRLELNGQRSGSKVLLDTAYRRARQRAEAIATNTVLVTGVDGSVVTGPSETASHTARKYEFESTHAPARLLSCASRNPGVHAQVREHPVR